METPFEQRIKILENEESQEHVELTERLKKTLYYGKIKNMECPSLAMTELAVEYLQELVPRELGRIDMYWASSLSRDVSVTPCALMLALMYLKRLKDNNSQYLNQVSSSDLFLISVLVASKYLYDEGENDDISNIQWACLTRTDIEDINDNERTFLHAMDWKVFVKPVEFWNFLHGLEEKVAWRMGLRRNSFTYTDLSVIVSVSPLCQILYEALVEIWKVVIVCAVAYCGCVVTLFASNVVPAVIFSQSLMQVSATVHAVPGVFPVVSLPPRAFHPTSCIPVARRMLDSSFLPFSSCKSSAKYISSVDIPLICDPWSCAWNPKICVCASACLTVALIQDILMSSYCMLSASVSSSISLAANLGYEVRHHLVGNRNYGSCSAELNGQSRDRTTSCRFRNASQPSTLMSTSSPTCVEKTPGPSRDCRLHAETEKVDNSHEGVLPFREKLSNSCCSHDNGIPSSSHNYSMTLSSIPQSYQLA